MRELVVKRMEVITVQIAFDLTVQEAEMQVAADAARDAVVERPTIGVMVDGTPYGGGGASRRSSAPMWLPVFDVRTLTRTGVELLVSSDDDASGQLDVLAPGLELPRDAITIKPRPGWNGHGHPALIR